MHKRLKWNAVGLERKTQILYESFQIEKQHEPPENLKNNSNLKVDDIINKIESQLDENLVDHEELKYWRCIRNDIIHKHTKIEKDNVEKGKEFFEEFFKNLNKYLSE